MESWTVCSFELVWLYKIWAFEIFCLSQLYYLQWWTNAWILHLFPVSLPKLEMVGFVCVKISNWSSLLSYCFRGLGYLVPDDVYKVLVWRMLSSCDRINILLNAAHDSWHNVWKINSYIYYIVYLIIIFVLLFRLFLFHEIYLK